MGRSKVYRRKPIWVKPDKINAVIDGARKYSPGFLYPMLVLVKETAAKTSDLNDLTWKDLDIKYKKVHFPGSVKIQRRVLDISSEAIAALKQVDQISTSVFTNLEGRPLRKEILVRELRILKRQLGLTEDCVFRDLRHSFGVNFLKAGGEIADLQKIMGHQHVRMTEELFGRYKTQRTDFFDVESLPGTGT